MANEKVDAKYIHKRINKMMKMVDDYEKEETAKLEQIQKKSEEFVEKFKELKQEELEQERDV